MIEDFQQGWARCWLKMFQRTIMCGGARWKTAGWHVHTAGGLRVCLSYGCTDDSGQEAGIKRNWETLGGFVGLGVAQLE